MYEYVFANSRAESACSNQKLVNYYIKLILSNAQQTFFTKMINYMPENLIRKIMR